VNDHQNQRVAGDAALTGIVNVLKLGPMFYKHHQRPHPWVHYKDTLHIASYQFIEKT